MDVAGVAAVLLLAVVGGLAALLAAATLTARPAVFLAAGAAVSALVAVPGTTLVLARAGLRRRRLVPALVALALAALVAATLVLRAPAPAIPAAPPPGATTLALPDGTVLSVMRLPADPAPTRSPVVVLHGGPGIPDLAANATVLAPLTAQGREVYLYAQRGSGASSRSSDPRTYGRDRDAADLEALRVRLGLHRMVLLAHSYGAQVAAAYAATHPERVERLVLVSPGPLDPTDTSPGNATGDLPAATRADLAGRVLAPRPLLGYLLLQVDPAAAHAFFPDAEADARNDAVLSLAQPALFCDDPPGGSRVTGSGFYALQYPQSATAPTPADIRPALSGLPVPTLIVKGSCDYLSWRSAIDYRRRLPDATLLYLAEAGHNAHQEQPAAFLAATTTFLDGRRLPSPTTADAAPPDYAGPP